MEKTNTQTAPVVAPVANPIISYVVKVFDGVFSESDIQTNRKYCFYRIANFESPKTKLRLNTVLSDDEIGEIINELSTLQFNRKLAQRVYRAGEASF